MKNIFILNDSSKIPIILQQCIYIKSELHTIFSYHPHWSRWIFCSY